MTKQFKIGDRVVRLGVSSGAFLVGTIKSVEFSNRYCVIWDNGYTEDYLSGTSLKQPKPETSADWD